MEKEAEMLPKWSRRRYQNFAEDDGSRQTKDLSKRHDALAENNAGRRQVETRSGLTAVRTDSQSLQPMTSGFQRTKPLQTHETLHQTFDQPE